MTAGDEFARLVDIMRRLRTDCPWDRSQTHSTLRTYLLEEAYEVLHALDTEHFDDLREELGDLLLQIVFHAEIAEEAGRFDMADVARGVCDKLVRRHPHVFGDKEAHTPADVLHRWEKIKRAEGKKESVLDGVPPELPALIRAVRTLSKVRQTGVGPFRGHDAREASGRWLDAFNEAAGRDDKAGAFAAAGMMLLSLSAAADDLHLNPEDALREVLSRLTEAFRNEELRLKADGRSLEDLTPEEAAAVNARLLAACEGD